MSDEKEFINGLIVKAPNENAPEYVKAKISIRRAELIAWLETKDGEWINADVKVSQGGKWYAQVDTWKPNTGNTSSSGPKGGAPSNRPARQAPVDDFEDTDIPFLTMRGAW